MLKKRMIAILLAGVTTGFLLAGCGITNTGTTDKENTADEEESTVTEYGIVNPEDVAKKLETAEEPSFSKEDIRGLSVVSGGEVLYQINYTEREDRQSFRFWDMVTPYASTAVIDSESMYELFDTLASLDLTSGSEDMVDNTQDPDSFDTYITLNYYESEDDDDQEVDPDHTFTLLIGEKEDSNYYCVLKGQEDKAMYLSSSLIDAVLEQEAYDLLIKVPYLVNYETVAEVDVTYKNKTYTMTMDGDTYTISGKEVEEDEYTSLYSDLMQPTLDGEITDDIELEDDREPLITIKYIRNLDNAVDYIVKIYSYDEEHYTISVNGEENFFLSGDDIDTLIKAIKKGF
ncbi:MAG: hypothetical protein LUE92_02550 [Clostridiales bacterium]|nr:hypothetical protein [Clostridiales bacterium]